MNSNGITISLFLCFVSTVGANAGSVDTLNGDDLLSTARSGFVEEILAIATTSRIEKAESVEAVLLIALDESKSVKARLDALASLLFVETAAMVPVDKIVHLLAKCDEDLSIRKRALLLCALLLHQQKDVGGLEVTLFKIFNSSDSDEEIRVSCANILLHFGSSTHSLARSLSKVMTDPHVSEQSIESFGIILYGLSAYNRVHTDEAINWLISQHLSSTMTTEQKLKYFSIVGYLEDHSESSSGDRLAPQTVVDLQLYFESEFSDRRNSDRVRGFAATFIKSFDLQSETIQAARAILADNTSSDSLKMHANRILMSVK